MDRARSYSRPPRRRDRSISTSPSPTRSPSRSRSRSHTRQSRRSASSSRQRSRSSSSYDSQASRPARRRSTSSSRHGKHRELLKTSAGLLAGIGIASYVAHKFWPKGIMYGDKEEWETTRKVVHRRMDDGRGGQVAETFEEEAVPGRRGERGAVEQRRVVERRGRERGRSVDGRGGRWDEDERRRRVGDEERRRRFDDEQRRRRWEEEQRREGDGPRSAYPEERMRRVDDGYARRLDGAYPEERYYRRDGQRAHPDELIYVVERPRR